MFLALIQKDNYVQKNEAAANIIKWNVTGKLVCKNRMLQPGYHCPLGENKKSICVSS